jgi:AcrR family transcriptional regulator
MSDAPARSGAETRDRILAVALALFASKGYTGTSVRDITERLGMTKASLYYHFASKEEILEALVQPLGEDLGALVERAREQPSVGAREILTRLVDVLSRRGGMVRAIMADPSGLPRRDPGNQSLRDHLWALVDILASGDPREEGEHMVRRLCARCAMGAAQVGVFSELIETPADPEPPTAEVAHRLLAGELPLLDEASQKVVVDAALRALDAGG